MAARVGSVEVLFDVNYGRAVAHARRFGDTIERQGDRTQRATRGIDRSVLSMNRSVRSMSARNFQIMGLSAVRASNNIDRLRTGLLAVTTLAGGLGTAFTLRGIQEYADTYTTIENRLRVVKRETATVAGLQQNLFDIAQGSRAQYEATAILFARIEQSSKRLNISQRDTLRATETIQKAFLVGGSTPIESAQSAIQLSQGIASNRLQGDELRSVLENPALGRLLAEEITDGDIGKLRELAEEGELTAKTIVNAFVNASDAIDELFTQTEMTFGQALVRLDNEILKAVGQNGAIDEGMRFSISAVNALADNMEGIIDALETIAVVALATFAGRGLRTLGTYTSAVRAQRQETLKLALEEKQASQARVVAAAADQQAAATRLAAQRSLLVQMYRGNETQKQIERQIRKSDKAQQQYTDAVRASQAAKTSAAVATGRLDVAQKNARLGTIAWTGSMNALRGAMSFLGGPVGLALIGVSVALSAQARNAQAAEERSDRYAEAIRRAGEANDGAGASIRETSRALKEQETQLSLTSAVTQRKQANEDLEASFGSLRLAAGRYITAVNREVSFDAAKQVSADLKRLIDGFEDGAVSAEDLFVAIEDLGRANPDIADLLDRLRTVAGEAAAARGEMDALNASIRSLSMPDINVTGPSGGRLGRPSLDDMRERARGGLSTEQLEQLATQQETALEDFEKQRREEAQSDRFSARLFGVEYKPERGRKGGKSDAQRSAEQFQKTIEGLRIDASIVGLDRIDQEAAKAARSIGLAGDEIAAFIAYARGEGGEPPAQIMAIRSEMEKIAALEFEQNLQGLRDEGALAIMDELDRQTIETARSFQIAESTVREFMAALDSGGEVPAQMAQIRVELESIAYNERLLQFADDLANAFGDFFLDSILGAESFEDALKGLVKQLAELYLRLLVIEPLTNSLRGAFSGAAGGGRGGLLGGFIIPGILHDGGDVGRAAGRFGHKEVLRLVEEGETMFTGDDTDRIGDALSRNVGPTSSQVYSPTYNIDATGADRAALDRVLDRLNEMDRNSYRQFQQNQRLARVRNKTV
ncbi:tape measure protein [Oceaniradius stylonematis]|uniref:tape measure protein n=1 Tax=Oceaniradius stylonematis TaxID=2184161 RepID=UPI00273D1724|nr:tape measure protein [Oceaniradius stylonematis]